MWSVYTIFALDIFQSIVAASEAWQTLCVGWGRPSNLQYPGWTFTGLPLVSGISKLVIVLCALALSWIELTFCY